ncbi:recombinase family protein [Guptibacillus hwajinpoensis]|uniref:DNA invertase Pin-like site-specific DNA recombinase n=1 Tax=Guptibacillus hwajinpoensis TaxID=208199 RepID=A0ABU0JWS5_9BACL|nr:recombinase family protein [Alkalihalobacillus hemicentroti]MDQ0481528.1 DNA invertase Pin-like site-specific DNA recombinase [Alkalihalobacillus hemicentroti]
MKKTVVYYRNSNEELQENSIAVQKSKALEYSIKHILPIDNDGVYEDRGTSAIKNKLEDRAQMSRLLEDVKQGKIENLLVYKRDRLARTSVEYMEIYRALKDNQVKIHFTADSEYPIVNSNFGDFIELILSGLIEHEIKQQKARISEAKRSKFEDGSYIGSLPYGYILDRKECKIIRVEEELVIVKQFYDLVLSEEFKGLNQIKKHIESLGLKTRSGAIWEVKKIEELLGNSIFRGERIMHFNGEPAFRKTKETAIISDDEWKKAQRIIGYLKPNRPKKEEEQQLFFLLDSKLVCGLCSQLLQNYRRQKKGELVGTYECKCSKIKIIKEDIEPIVLKRVNDYFTWTLKDNYEKYAHRYYTEQKMQINKLLNDNLQSAKNIKKQLVEVTKKWMNEVEEVKKNEKKLELINIKDKLDNLESKSNQLFKDIKAIDCEYEIMLKHKVTNKVLEKDIYHIEPQIAKKFIDDLVLKIVVRKEKKIILDFQFMHPFETFKEVQ